MVKRRKWMVQLLNWDIETYEKGSNRLWKQKKNESYFFVLNIKGPTTVKTKSFQNSPISLTKTSDLSDLLLLPHGSRFFQKPALPNRLFWYTLLLSFPFSFVISLWFRSTKIPNLYPNPSIIIEPLIAPMLVCSTAYEICWLRAGERLVMADNGVDQVCNSPFSQFLISLSRPFSRLNCVVPFHQQVSSEDERNVSSSAIGSSSYPSPYYNVLQTPTNFYPYDWDVAHPGNVFSSLSFFFVCINPFWKQPLWVLIALLCISRLCTKHQWLGWVSTICYYPWRPECATG